MYKRTAAIILISVLSLAISGCSPDSQKTSAAADASVQQDGDYSRDLVEGIAIDDNAALVTEAVADIFIEPDIKSERVTQALYNQPVSILEEKGAWTKVAAVDGSKGWLRTKAIDRNITSVYGGDFARRIVVTSKDKSITAYSNGSMTLKNVSMGTELYSFNEDGDAYEVYLPGNKTGWLKGSGMISLGVSEEIPLTGAQDFVSTAMKFKGTCYLIRGTSSQGVDSAGLVYISARINGLKLPRTLEAQLHAGTEIGLSEAGAGDLVFIAPKGDRNFISTVGICTGSGSYIYSGRNTGYVAVKMMNEENNDGVPAMARRIFIR